MRRMMLVVGLVGVVVTAVLAGNAANTVPWGAARKIGGISDWELLHDSFPKWQDMSDSMAAAGAALPFDSAVVAANAHTLQGRDTTTMVRPIGTGSDSLGNHLVVQATRFRGALTGNVTGMADSANGSARAAGITTSGTDTQVWGMNGANQAWIAQTGVGGISAAAASESIQAHLPEIRDTSATVVGESLAQFRTYTEAETTWSISSDGDSTGFMFNNGVLYVFGNITVNDNRAHAFATSYWSTPRYDTAASGRVQIDASLGNNWFLTADSVADTVDVINAEPGQHLFIDLTGAPAGTAATTVVWDGGVFMWPDSTAPVLPLGAGVYHDISLVCVAESVYRGAAGVNMGPP